MIDVAPIVTVSVDGQGATSVTVDGRSPNEVTVEIGTGSGITSLTWDAIQNKPATFPPEPHHHISDDISDLHTQPIRGGIFHG